jgi:DNA-binding transcriptional ArsR family regulator
MPEINAVGDLVLTKAQEFAALSDPLALRLTDRLRREGPAEASALAAQLGAPEAEVEARLAELRRLGIVERGPDGWRAVAKGFVFEIPADREDQAAARELAKVMLLQYVDEPRQWVAETEPKLELDWVRASGQLNARLALTPDELRTLQEDIEKLLAPYIVRSPGEIPMEARRVRILGYFLPATAASRPVGAQDG